MLKHERLEIVAEILSQGCPYRRVLQIKSLNHYHIMISSNCEVCTLMMLYSGIKHCFADWCLKRSCLLCLKVVGAADLETRIQLTASFDPFLIIHFLFI